MRPRRVSTAYRYIIIRKGQPCTAGRQPNMKTVKKLILSFIAFIASAAAFPALADIPVGPFGGDPDRWILWLAIGVFAIAAAVLIVLIIRARKRK